MDGPPLKKLRNESPSFTASFDTGADVNWVNEFNSELPDELSELGSSNPSNQQQQQQTTAVSTSGKSKTAADDTIQRNRNLSALLSDVATPMYSDVSPGMRGMKPGGFGPGGVVVVQGNGSGGMVIGAGGGGGRLCHPGAQDFGMGGPRSNYMGSGGSHVFPAQMNHNTLNNSIYHQHNGGSRGSMMMPNNYGMMQPGMAPRHPDFMRNRSMTNNNSYLVPNDARMHVVNGNMVARHSIHQMDAAAGGYDSFCGAGAGIGYQSRQNTGVGFYPGGPFVNGSHAGVSQPGHPPVASWQHGVDGQRGGLSAQQPHEHAAQQGLNNSQQHNNLSHIGQSAQQQGLASSGVTVQQLPHGIVTQSGGHTAQKGGLNQTDPGPDASSRHFTSPVNCGATGTVNDVKTTVTTTSSSGTVKSNTKASRATSVPSKRKSSSLSVSQPALPLQPSPSPNSQSTTLNSQMHTESLSSEPGLSSLSSLSSSSSPPTNEERRRNVQEQLALLLHAHRCQRKDQQLALTSNTQTNGVIRHCPNQKCASMKITLKHMTECQEDQSCKVSNCAMLRTIIKHWKNCVLSDCPICSPLKNPGLTKKNNVVVSMSAARQSSPRTLSMSSESVCARLSSDSSLTQSAGSHTGDCVLVTSGFNDAPPDRSDMRKTYETLGIDPASDRLHHSSDSSLAGRIPGLDTGGVGGNIAGVGSGVVAKEWHRTIALDLRNHLVHKLVQAIFPQPDQSMLMNQRMGELVQYARKVEGDMFDSADSKEEYYQLLAEKIYKIQRELDEKRMKRMMEGSLPVTPGSRGQIIPGSGMHPQQPSLGQPAMPLSPPPFDIADRLMQADGDDIFSSPPRPLNHTYFMQRSFAPGLRPQLNRFGGIAGNDGYDLIRHRFPAGNYLAGGNSPTDAYPLSRMMRPMGPYSGQDSAAVRPAFHGAAPTCGKVASPVLGSIDSQPKSTSTEIARTSASSSSSLTSVATPQTTVISSSLSSISSPNSMAAANMSHDDLPRPDTNTDCLQPADHHNVACSQSQNDTSSTAILPQTSPVSATGQAHLIKKGEKFTPPNSLTDLLDASPLRLAHCVAPSSSPTAHEDDIKPHYMENKCHTSPENMPTAVKTEPITEDVEMKVKHCHSLSSENDCDVKSSNDRLFKYEPVPTIATPQPSPDEFKYNTAVHEDITDDEAENASGESGKTAVPNSMIKVELKESVSPVPSVNTKYELKQESSSGVDCGDKDMDDGKCEKETEDEEEDCGNSEGSHDSAQLPGPQPLSDDVASTPAADTMGSEAMGQKCSIKRYQSTGGRKEWTQEELLESLMPVLDGVFEVEPEAAPFRIPVDPDFLGIPDYTDIVKNPMDMSTIRYKLMDGQYNGPWDFISDFALMFDNAWLYNKKTSKVYKFCSKLAEIFDSKIDLVMKSLGFCCGRRFVFTPQVLCCYGKQLCAIPRDNIYYNYQDRYLYCEKCFNELQGDDIEMADDPSQPGLKIKKEQFVREKNDRLDREQFVECLDCGRKMHKICVLHMEQIWPEGFTCDACLQLKSIKRRDNKYAAKRLPTTKLSSYLETRVNRYLKCRDARAGEVTIRVLSTYDKFVEVKPGMKSRFVENSEIPDTYPYRVKAMFAFEEIDGVDVCFFGMHVQEYGSDCPSPNARRVYIAYLDSVHFFQPKQYRTSVYHEILIGYMDYAKSLGYQTAHIWACPPSDGDDYIFHCHPPDQKIPKPRRLQDWYKKMLDKAQTGNVIHDYKDIAKDAVDNGVTSVTQIPYFEGDFWPNIMEDCIKELEQEEQKRRREEEEAAADTADDFEPNVGDCTQVQPFAGKKKGQKSGKTKKKNSKSKKPVNRKSKSGVAHGGNDLSQKVLSTMEKLKEGFFVIRLNAPDVELQDIKDPDPLINCDLMDGRDAFLTLSRDKHYEFSSLRRAKYSSMGLLYELHNQAKDGFVYTCNDCRASVETRYHCTVCEDLDLCVQCYLTSNHPHKMIKLGLDLDDTSSAASSTTSVVPSSSSTDGSDSKNTPEVVRRVVSIQTYVTALLHACHCRDANCRLPSCHKMKRVVSHNRACSKRKTSGGSCAICSKLLQLCLHHAKTCKESRCLVPYCLTIREKLEKQRAEQQFKDQQLMRRRMAQMHKMRAVAAVESQKDEPSTSAESPAGQPDEEDNGKQMTPPPNCGGGGGKHSSGKSPLSGALMAARLAEQAAQRQAGLNAGGGVYMTQQQATQQQQMMMKQRQMMMMGHMMDQGGGPGSVGPGNWHGVYPGGSGRGMMMNGPNDGHGDHFGCGPQGGGPMMPSQEEIMYHQQMMSQMGGGRSIRHPAHGEMVGFGGGGSGRADLQRMLSSPGSLDQGSAAETNRLLESKSRLSASNNQRKSMDCDSGTNVVPIAMCDDEIGIAGTDPQQRTMHLGAGGVGTGPVGSENSRGVGPIGNASELSEPMGSSGDHGMSSCSSQQHQLRMMQQQQWMMQQQMQHGGGGGQGMEYWRPRFLANMGQQGGGMSGMYSMQQMQHQQHMNFGSGPGRSFSGSGMDSMMYDNGVVPSQHQRMMFMYQQQQQHRRMRAQMTGSSSGQPIHGVASGSVGEQMSPPMIMNTQQQRSQAPVSSSAPAVDNLQSAAATTTQANSNVQSSNSSALSLSPSPSTAVAQSPAGGSNRGQSGPPLGMTGGVGGTGTAKRATSPRRPPPYSDSVPTRLPNHIGGSQWPTSGGPGVRLGPYPSGVQHPGGSMHLGAGVHSGDIRNAASFGPAHGPGGQRHVRPYSGPGDAHPGDLNSYAGNPSLDASRLRFESMGGGRGFGSSSRLVQSQDSSLTYTNPHDSLSRFVNSMPQ